MSVVGECFFWYWLTRVVPDKFHRAVKQLCVVCVLLCQRVFDWPLVVGNSSPLELSFRTCSSKSFTRLPWGCLRAGWASHALVACPWQPGL